MIGVKNGKFCKWVFMISIWIYKLNLKNQSKAFDGKFVDYFKQQSSIIKSGE